MQTLLSNVRLAARTLARTPGFTIVVALILGLGIGATTALYSAVDAVLLRPGLYSAPDELVHVERHSASVEAAAVPWSFVHFNILRERRGPFQDVAAFASREVTLRDGVEPVRVRAEFITDNYLTLLGVPVALGRPMRADAADGTPEALLAHRTWRERFAGDSDIVGRTVRLNGRDVVVAGVLPAGFRGEAGAVDIWLPAEAAPQVTGDASFLEGWVMPFYVVGRLQPGLAAETAEAHLLALNDAIVEDGQYSLRLGDGPLRVIPMKGSRVEPRLRQALFVVFGAAVTVLLIACLNIGSLLLARSHSRRREIAVRRALGASNWKLAQQFLSEGLVLALLGGVIGLGVALWTLDLLRLLQPSASPGFWSGYVRALSFHDIAIDGRVLRFAALATLGSGLLFGMLPALRSGMADLGAALRQGSGTVGRERGGVFNLRSALVVGEISLAFVLLAAAGLLTRSFLVTHATDFGFQADRVVTMRLQLPSTQYPMTRVATFMDELDERVRALPGVTHVGVSAALPLTGGTGTTDFVPEGRETDENLPLPTWTAVTPDYFAALRIPPQSGRLIESGDRAGSPRVVVINETLARMLFPGENPVGRRVGLGVAFFNAPDPAEIVGVVADIPYAEVDADPVPMVYLSMHQRQMRSLYFSVRTNGDIAQLSAQMRQQVAALDPELAISEVATMRERVSTAASKTRFGAVLVSMFALLAGVLAVLGIYGVMATAVAARTREVAIRMALGGQRADVIRTVLQEGVVLLAAGIVLGLAGAVATMRLLQAQLFGVDAHDPLTFAAVITALGAVALLAAWVPALRAARVDPNTALRE